MNWTLMSHPGDILTIQCPRNEADELRKEIRRDAQAICLGRKKHEQTGEDHMEFWLVQERVLLILWKKVSEVDAERRAPAESPKEKAEE